MLLKGHNFVSITSDLVIFDVGNPVRTPHTNDTRFCGHARKMRHWLAGYNVIQMCRHETPKRDVIMRRKLNYLN